MISLIVSTLIPFILVTNDFEFKKFQPYLGVQVSAFPDKVEESGNVYKRHKKFLTLGLPYNAKEYNIGDLRPISLLTLPEFVFHQDLFQMNLGVGPEMRIPLSQSVQPSGFFFGGQLGFFWLWYYAPGTHQNDQGEPFTSSDQLSIGPWINTYFGPEFDILGKYLFKLQINPKFYFGRISRHLFRIQNSQYVGMTLGVNLQLQFQ
jgi:hypothetical protein